MSQKERYEQIWLKNANPANAVLRDIASLRAIPDKFDYALTYAFFPQDDLKYELSNVIDDLKINFSMHYYLPMNYLHLSLSYLTKYNKEDDEDKVVKLYQDFLTEKLLQYPISPLEVSGINHFRNCIFAQVWDKNGWLEDLNREIAQIFNIKNSYTFTPHIALAYFEDNPGELFKYVNQKMRKQKIGIFLPKKICLVKWKLHRKDESRAYEIVK